MTLPARSRAAAIADGVVLLCLAGAVWLVLVGSYRLVIGGEPLTLRWSHPLFAAAVIAAVRHAVWATPSMFATIAEGRAWMSARPAMSDALWAFTLTRPVVLLVGLLAVSAIGFPPDSGQLGSGRQALSGLGARFDGNWYAGIAASGYDWEGTFTRQQNMAFFPAYPMLMRAVGTVTGGMSAKLTPEQRLFRLTACGIAISLAAFLWAAWYFARLSRELLDDDRARDALWLLAAYPFAVFFSAAYTESLFLLAALGAWYSLRHDRLVSASAWGLIAGLARPNGFFLSVPLGLIALGLRDAPAGRTNDRAPLVGRPRLWHLVAASMPVVGMLAFTTYLYWLIGEWFAWARLHAAWGRVFSTDVPIVGVTRNTNGLLDLMTVRPFDALNLLGVVFALGMLWAVWRRVGPAWVAFVLINVVPPLFAGGLLSMGRLSATMFPVFLALGAVLPARSAAAVVAGFALMQGLVAAMFFTWRALY